MTPDTINGIFETAGSLFLSLNIIQAVKDRQLQGVSWIPTLFFTSWAAWNLFYYPALDQWFSFFGSCFIVIAQCAWLSVILMMKYKLWIFNERT